MAEGQKALISIGLDDFVQAGLFQEGDVEVVTLRAVMFDYGGTRRDKVLAVCGTLKDLKAGDVFEEHWSAGTGFVPNHDGTGFVAAEDGGATQMAKGSNFYNFLDSLHNQGGMPKNKLREPGGLSLLDGAQFHARREAQQARPGIPQRTEPGARPPTTLLCAGPAIRWPWDLKGKGRKPAATVHTVASAPTAAPAPAAGAGDDAEVSTLAASALEAVTADGDTFDATKLRSMTFQQIGPGVDRGLREKAVKLALDPDFLAEHGFVLEGKVVTKVPE